MLGRLSRWNLASRPFALRIYLSSTIRIQQHAMRSLKARAENRAERSTTREFGSRPESSVYGVVGWCSGSFPLLTRWSRPDAYRLFDEGNYANTGVGKNTSSRVQRRQ